MSDYTVLALTDAPDVLGDYPGEMRFLTRPLGAEQTALTWRRMPPDSGSRGSYGHRHKSQEELYLAGRLSRARPEGQPPTLATPTRSSRAALT